jgi:hypothetical protein
MDASGINTGTAVLAGTGLGSAVAPADGVAPPDWVPPDDRVDSADEVGSGALVAACWATDVGLSPPQAAMKSGTKRPAKASNRPLEGLEIVNESRMIKPVYIGYPQIWSIK